jgi:hypothetical protein
MKISNNTTDKNSSSRNQKNNVSAFESHCCLTARRELENDYWIWK